MSRHSSQATAQPERELEPGAKLVEDTKELLPFGSLTLGSRSTLAEARVVWNDGSLIRAFEPSAA